MHLILEGLHPPAERARLPRPETRAVREIGVVLPNNQRQHRTLRIQKDVLPC